MSQDPETLYRIGRVTEAEAACRAQLARQPRDPGLLHLLGLILLARREFEAALDLVSRAIETKPDDPAILNTLGNLYRALKQPDIAEIYLLRALSIAPEKSAITANLAACLLDLDQPEAALALLEPIIMARPDFLDARLLRADIRARLNQLDDAAADYSAVLQRQPGHAPALCGLGDADLRQRRFSTAIRHYQAARRIDPDHAEAALGEAHAQLALGNYADGFALYEARWRAHGSSPRALAGPAWDGSHPAGRTILVYGERGLGDMIQFARFLPQLNNLGAQVIVEVPAALVRLFTELPGLAAVVTAGDSLPDYDAHVALLSLPRLLGTALSDLSGAAYLSTRNDDQQKWHQRLSALPGRKLGIVWSGNTAPDLPEAAVLRGRAARLGDFAPLGALEDTQFISLQKGDASAELRHAPACMIIHDWTAELRDMADTAGLIAALDGLVTIDTSVAHLAGALGRPVDIALMHDACWRWLIDRDDSPWYDSARLYRQSIPGNWTGVLQAIADRYSKRIS